MERKDYAIVSVIYSWQLWNAEWPSARAAAFLADIARSEAESVWRSGRAPEIIDHYLKAAPALRVH
jgi:hypothetical protein